MYGLHLFALVAFTVCIVAGMWQLGVYDSRQAAAREVTADQPAVPLLEIWKPGEFLTSDQNKRRVEVTGEFLPADQQFWVTPKEQDEIEGAWLTAPVRAEGSLLLVVRGWAPAAGELLPVPDGQVSFEAILLPSESTADGWDEEARTIGSVRTAAMLNVYDEPLWNGWALGQDPEISAGLEIVPPPESSVSWLAGGRNLGYGLQWWVFAGFVIFMWWRMGSEKIRTHQEANLKP